MTVGRNQFNNFVNLFQKTIRKHFVCLVDDQSQKSIGLQKVPIHHISYSTRSTHHNMAAFFQIFLIDRNRSSSNAQNSLYFAVCSQGSDYFVYLSGQFSSVGQYKSLYFLIGRVYSLQTANNKSGCFTRTRLCLGDYVSSLNYWANGLLLYHRRVHEPEPENSPQKVLFELHVLELRYLFIPVTLE